MDQAANPPDPQIYKVALASIIGSVIEQYDFLVTGVIAATVWGGLYFKLPGLAAVAAAISVLRFPISAWSIPAASSGRRSPR
jgi:hypothetical protein